MKIFDESEINKNEYDNGVVRIKAALKEDGVLTQENYDKAIGIYNNTFNSMVNKKLINKKFRVTDLNEVALNAALGRVTSEEFNEYLKTIKNQRDENLYDVLKNIK